MIRFSIVLGLTLAIMGCNENPSQTTPSNPSHNQRNGDNNELFPISPNIVYASTWSGMTINAVVAGYYAKTGIDSGAHFSIDRNSCGKSAFGPIHLEEWNSLAQYTNEALQAHALITENCVDSPIDTDTYVNDIVITIEEENKKTQRTLYEMKDGQICTTISNRETSDNLMKAILKVIATAPREDCPNGWGS